MKAKAVVLLSGGLDSSTCLYWARAQGYRAHCLVFDYGQRHGRELESAARIARRAGAPYWITRFSLPWGGGALTDKRAPLPGNRKARAMAAGKIPSTYVPARNTIFLSFALSCADAIGAGSVVIGANAVDYSGYPDCRPQYLRAMRRAALLGTRRGAEGEGIRILAPLIRMSKAEIIRLGSRLGVPYRWTWSCYRGGKRPCGTCDSCVLRREGFAAAGQEDPLPC